MDGNELYEDLHDVMNTHCLAPDELAKAAVQFSIDYSIWIEESFLCLDCYVHTGLIKHYYTLHDELWKQANPDIDGMLCWKCLEVRLGRPLTPDDFDDTIPVNDNISARLDAWRNNVHVASRGFQG